MQNFRIYKEFPHALPIHSVQQAWEAAMAGTLGSIDQIRKITPGVWRLAPLLEIKSLQSWSPFHYIHQMAFHEEVCIISFGHMEWVKPLQTADRQVKLKLPLYTQWLRSVTLFSQPFVISVLLMYKEFPFYAFILNTD